jgi:hypothetical protein
MILIRKTKALAEKAVAVSFCPPRMSQEMSWDRTRALQLKQHSKLFPSRLQKKTVT